MLGKELWLYFIGRFVSKLGIILGPTLGKRIVSTLGKVLVKILVGPGKALGITLRIVLAITFILGSKLASHNLQVTEQNMLITSSKQIWHHLESSFSFIFTIKVLQEYDLVPFLNVPVWSIFLGSWILGITLGTGKSFEVVNWVLLGNDDGMTNEIFDNFCEGALDRISYGCEKGPELDISGRIELGKFDHLVNGSFDFFSFQVGRNVNRLAGTADGNLEEDTFASVVVFSNWLLEKREVGGFDRSNVKKLLIWYVALGLGWYVRVLVGVSDSLIEVLVG